jgi:hypothetical protein
LVLGNRFAERSLYGRTRQDEIDTRNEISQKKLAQGQFLDSCRQMVTLSVCLCGDPATGTVAHETLLSEAWIQKRFPTPTEPGKGE